MTRRRLFFGFSTLQFHGELAGAAAAPNGKLDFSKTSQSGLTLILEDI